ncbi:MAG: 16S rRNA (cytosine(967)-C(5))-methyltransferase RsmB [Deltaproteobacteria bacterium]|nr:16S rRNA (cytosine(967)-C(5))-methyltransferase RsmB [Deltaproteobacteria bacterium]
MNSRSMAMHILMQVAQQGSHADVLLSGCFKRQATLDARDRAFITELVYGTLRWQARLDWIIDRYARMKSARMALPVRVILRLATYQLLYLDRVPPSAAVNEAVKLAKASQPLYIVRFVNAVLRSIAANRDALRDALPEKSTPERWAVAFSFPGWLIEKWLAELGQQETEAFCRSSNEVAPTTIRVNTLKTTVTELARVLGARGFKVTPGRFSPEAIHLDNIRTDLSSLPEYLRGEFQVQDEAAQLVSHLVAPQPGERILDACAGLGGKSTHLGQLMKNEGRLTAMDKQGWRLNHLQENARRLQISCIDTKEVDLLEMGAAHPWLASFDRILLDAPCSGLGVLRRKPDIKWKINKKDLRRLQRTQLALLAAVAPMVRPGGLLVYATCTVSREENEAVVQEFLGCHADFCQEAAVSALPRQSREVVDENGNLRTWPHKHGIDGFFAVRLRRAARHPARLHQGALQWKASL